MNLKVLVLGGGFIGSRIHQNLLTEGFDAKLVSSKDCDLTDRSATSKLMNAHADSQCIVFTAAVTRLQENSASAALKNIDMIRNLLISIENRQIKQIIFFSTIDVYGKNTRDFIQETDPLEPFDFYGLSKAVSERILQDACSRLRVPLTIFRLVGIYGPGDRGRSTVSRLVHSARTKNEISITGKGSTLRDFVDADDVARIVALALKKSQAGIYNVATGHSRQIVDYANIIKEFINKDCAFRYNTMINQDREYNLSFDTTKLKNDFPEFEFTNIETIMQRYSTDCERTV